MKIPILKHGDILLTSFQDDLTDRDALNLQADLLEMIERFGTRAVLMDVTAVEVIDSYQAKMITETAAMTRLLGCEVVLSGIQPKVAMTLVELGNAMAGIRTVLNLQQGLNMLQMVVDRNEVDADLGEETPSDAVDDQGDVQAEFRNESSSSAQGGSAGAAKKPPPYG